MCTGRSVTEEEELDEEEVLARAERDLMRQLPPDLQQQLARDQQQAAIGIRTVSGWGMDHALLPSASRPWLVGLGQGGADQARAASRAEDEEGEEAEEEEGGSLGSHRRLEALRQRGLPFDAKLEELEAQRRQLDEVGAPYCLPPSAVFLPTDLSPRGLS